MIKKESVHQAWCWCDGLIEFGAEPPDGGQDVIVFAAGPASMLERVVSKLADAGTGKHEGKLFVPGLAQSQEVSTVVEWMKSCARGNGRVGRYGVVFREELA